MKGIFIINSLEGGGAERIFTKLVSLKASRGGPENIEVVLIDQKHEAYRLPGNVVIHRLPKGSVIANLLSFLRIIKASEPLYIVSFLTRANVFNVIGSLFYRYKSIISERSNTSGRLVGRLSWIKRLVTGLVYKQSTAIIAVSEGVKRCLVDEYGVDGQKVEVVNNPVDIDFIKKRAGDTQTTEGNKIVAMGRLIKSKGFDNLLKAYAKANVPAKLKILGQGPELNNLRQLSKALGIADKVEFSGFQENPYVHIKQALCFVLPSKLEGFPNALVEAMALGKAVISTDCTDGPSEILVKNSEIFEGEFIETGYGLMVNIDDSRAMASSIVRIFNDEDLRKKLSGLSAERALAYTPDKFYTNFLKILNKYT